MAVPNKVSDGNSQQWSDEVAKSSEQLENQDVTIDPQVTEDPNEEMNKQEEPNQMVAGTVCCSQSNCAQLQLELMPDQFYQHDPTENASADGNADGGDPSSENGQVRVPLPEPLMPYCPCALSGQLVTYCCMRPDCDEASKIGGEPRERKTAKKF